MKRIIIVFLLIKYTLLGNAQITYYPVVANTSQHRIPKISLVKTGKNVTEIMIDCTDAYKQGYGWISLSKKTKIYYQDPETGEYIEKEIVPSIEVYCQSENTKVSYPLGEKLYFQKDFGSYPIWPIITIYTHPLPVGLKEFSISENISRGFDWTGIRIRPVNHSFGENIGDANSINYMLKTSKSSISGIYRNIVTNKEFALVERSSSTSKEFCLIYNKEEDDILCEYEVGNIYASLSPTVVTNTFMATIYDYDAQETKQKTAVIENGILSIIDKDETERYVKMLSVGAENIDSNIQKEEWSGTGFALKQGYFITNYHVVEDATKIEVYCYRNNSSYTYNAKIIGSDKINDLSLLKIENDNYNNEEIPFLFTPTMSDVGIKVYTLGYPLTQTMGEEIKLTDGIISARSGYDGNVANYQISVPLQPGNSGGPLLDMDGNLIGVVCAKHKDAENASYAIKSLYVKNLVESVADASILPDKNSLNSLPLHEQVKKVKNYVYLIKCSK